MDHALRRPDLRLRPRHLHCSPLEEPACASHRRRPAPPSRRRIGTIPRSGQQGDRPMSFELACCLLFTVAVLFYVFYLPGKLYLGPEKTRAAYLRERRDVVYENLRDLNFEYKAGKVPDADYQSMKASLQDEAATLLAEIARLERNPPPAPRRAKA